MVFLLPFFYIGFSYYIKISLEPFEKVYLANFSFGFREFCTRGSCNINKRSFFYLSPENYSFKNNRIYHSKNFQNIPDEEIKLCREKAEIFFDKGLGKEYFCRKYPEPT
jgi:hypothetical protein